MTVRIFGRSGTRTRSALVVVAVTALAVLPIASPAHAAGPPSGEPLECRYDTANGVESCFEVDGDDFWVKDTRADGGSARVAWIDDWGSSVYCTNSNGAGKWKECNYDMPEGELLQWTNEVFDVSENEILYQSGWNGRYYSCLTG